MKTLLLALPLAAIAACATSSNQAQDDAAFDRALRMERTRDCMFQSTINNFNALDDRHVILYGAGRGNAYLAELTPGCFQIRSSATLGAVDGDNNGQICSYGRDSLAYRGLGRTETCRIIALEKLSENRLYQLTGELPRTPEDRDRKKDEEKAKEDDDGE